MGSFLQLLVILVHVVTLAEGLSKTTFTLYTTPAVTWQTAVTFCRDQGQDLVRVTSQEEQNFLTSLGQSGGIWHSKISGVTWSSLYNADPASEGPGRYQWQLQASDQCLLLGEDSWQNWSGMKPLRDPQNRCVSMEWTVSTGYRWRVDNCEHMLARVICRSDQGTCNVYNRFRDRRIQQSQNVMKTYVETTTEALCCHTCSNTHKGAFSCYAAEWMNGSVCVLNMAQARLSVEDSEVNRDSVLNIPSCLYAAVKDADFSVSQQPFNPSCADLSATSLKEETESADTSTTFINHTTIPSTTATSTVFSPATSAATDTGTEDEGSQKDTPQHTISIPRTALASNLAQRSSEMSKIDTTDTGTKDLGTQKYVPQEVTSSQSTALSSSITHSSSGVPETDAKPSSPTATSPKEETESADTSTTIINHTTTPSTTATSTVFSPATSADTDTGTEDEGTQDIPQLTTSTTGTTVDTSIAQSSSEQQEALSRLLKTLTVDHKNTASYKRKYTSAEDPRRSAQTIGYVGVVVLVMVVAVILSLDLSGVCCDRAQRVEPHSDTASVERKWQ